MLLKIIKKISNVLRFPKLSLSTSSRVSNFGTFNYGSSCIIEKNCNIAINDKLILCNNIFLRSNLEVVAARIFIGSDVRIEKGARLFGNIEIGSYTLIGANLFASSSAHEFKQNPYFLINDQDELKERNKENNDSKIVIGEDVWIGINVFIAPGIIIGRGSIIGANSTVLKDLPPYSVSMGQPARPMSKRLEFKPPSQIEVTVQNIPYFYKGFNLRKSHFDKHSDFVRAELCDLELAIEHKVGDMIFLIINGVENIFHNNKKISKRDDGFLVVIENEPVKLFDFNLFQFSIAEDDVHRFQFFKAEKRN